MLYMDTTYTLYTSMYLRWFLYNVTIMLHHCAPHCRHWHYDVPTESYVFVSMSVSHPCADLQASIRATELATRYLIEPLTKDSTRLTVMSRVDMRYDSLSLSLFPLVVFVPQFNVNSERVDVQFLVN